ncbi:hypothetical protein GCM10025791_06220 [Halioxenophilus aromaticivorans]|uniref:Uncharacterized protein n=2 Tax=Halioxenophilus aromaticivorans TaxID=1306992 RepID=A0AAV3TYR4_9ALTE
MNHMMEIPANYITPVDKDLIPTGELQPVARTPFDFTKGKIIGQDIEHNDKQLQYGQGYDHTWIINLENTGTLKPAAKVVEPGSGRILEVFTTSPGMQFYSGNFLDGSTSGKGLPHNQRTAFCLEPQHFPDSPNKPAFPGTILEPGQT